MPAASDDRSPGAHGQRARRRRPATRAGRWAVWLGVAACAVFLLLLVSTPLLERYDERWVSCEVTDATPVGGGWRSTPHVELSTTNCGAVTVPAPADQAGAHQVADGFARGATYEFKLGTLSRLQAEHKFPRLAAAAKEFRPLATG